jgi:hypothetical protein
MKLRKILSALVLLTPTVVAAQSYYPSPAIQPSGDAGASGWRQPAPYAREDQVDQGTPSDAAHKADRAYTAYLNSRPITGWNQTSVTPSRADAAQYARNLRQYQADRAEYARNIAAWRSDVGYDR